VAIHRDLTAEKAAEAVLRESESQLAEANQLNRMIFETSPTGLGVYDATSGRCVAANDSLVRVVGGTQKQMLGQNYRLLASWQKSGLLEMAEEALEDGASGPRDLISTRRSIAMCGWRAGSPACRSITSPTCS